MNVTKNTNLHKLDGLMQIEELYKDLLRLSSTTQLTPRVINNLISKVNIIIEIIRYSPRLPLFQVETSIKDICKRDPSTQGVIVEILFSKKYGEIDKTRLSKLIVNV